MRAYFIFNNLKVSLHPNDAPFPGFDMLGHEKQCSTLGTLWDIGGDAGYTVIGKTKVKGQLWIAENLDAIDELEFYIGAKKGLTEPTKVKVDFVYDDPPVHETLDAIVYRLTEIKKNYRIVNDGWWALYRKRDLIC